MTTLSIEGFSGIMPRLGPSRLGEANAQVASNVKLQSGELRPWRKPVFEFAPTTPNTQGIYKLNGPGGLTQWLEFPQDTDVVGSPVADTNDFRIYYTGAGISPRKTNWTLATTGTGPAPRAFYEMGVPAPVGSPALTPSSSAAPAETRAYVYTFVNQFGAVFEESAPSPAGTVTVSSSGATVTVSSFSAPPAGNYNWKFINIYRTVTGTSSVSFQFVAQIPVGTPSYVDGLTVTQLGQILPSTFFTPPPATLQGLTEMPNGILAGFTGNQVWFCEPFFPHAWPVVYMQTVEFPITGLGVFGSTLFVGTQKNPYLITGTTSASMTVEKLPILQSCVSKRSVVSDQWGVVYASPNGLVAVGPGINDIVTQNLYTRDEWQPLSPSQMLGVLYNNMYIGFHPNGSGGTTSFVFTRADIPPLSTYDFDAGAVFVERSTGNIYALSQTDNKIYHLDADPINATIYQWQSRNYILPEPANFTCLKVEADFQEIADEQAYEAIIAADLAANTALFASSGSKTLGGGANDFMADTLTVDGSNMILVPEITDTKFITVLLFADGKQVFQTPIFSDGVLRLPAGFKAVNWSVTITGNVSVRKVTMATTVREIRMV